MTESHELFRVVTTTSGDTTFLDLHGELDFFSMPEFEVLLESAISKKPANILFDLSDASFICGAAYGAIGRCSRYVEHVMICAKDGFAQKILRAIGYDQIVFVTMEHSLLRSKVTQAAALGHLVEREAS